MVFQSEPRRWHPCMTTPRNSIQVYFLALYQTGDSEAKWYHFTHVDWHQNCKECIRLCKCHVDRQLSQILLLSVYLACYWQQQISSAEVACLPSTCISTCNNLEGEIMYWTRLYVFYCHQKLTQMLLKQLVYHPLTINRWLDIVEEGSVRESLELRLVSIAVSWVLLPPSRCQ